MSTQGQSTMNKSNMLQTTIGIVSTSPLDMTKDMNKGRKEDTKEKIFLFKIYLVHIAKRSNLLGVLIEK